LPSLPVLRVEARWWRVRGQSDSPQGHNARLLPFLFGASPRSWDGAGSVRVTIPELGIELRPYKKGPCWQLFEFVSERTNRDGGTIPDAWLSAGVYPSTLEHGLRIIAERAARRSAVAGDLHDALSEVQRIGDVIVAACYGLSLP
jgi:hypothetical protein